MITKTQLETDLANVQRAVDAASYSVASLASALDRAHAAVWQLPDDRLSALLNHLGATQVNAIFSAHQSISTAVNVALDASNSQAKRAKTTAGREFTVAEDGTFSVIPLPKPQQPTEPQPE
jgi:hypothetical protein